MRNYLFPLVKKLLKTGLVNKWFWIRYKDPEYHLRVRLETDETNVDENLHAFTASLNKLIRSKLIFHFQSDTYKRELERYSPELIETVESVFHESSSIIATKIMADAEINYDDHNTFIDAVVSLIIILNSFEFSSAESGAFCKQQFKLFYEELNSPVSLKTDLENIYKKIDESITNQIRDGCSNFNGLATLIKALRTHLKNRKPLGISEGCLAADIIHMHLNRLFVLDQRYFEMITYFLGYRKITADLHRNLNGGIVSI